MTLLTKHRFVEIELRTSFHCKNERYTLKAPNTPLKGKIEASYSEIQKQFPHISQFLDAKKLIKAIVNLRHPDEHVAWRTPRPRRLHSYFTRAECSPLHCLRTSSALGNQVLERFCRARHSNCEFFNVLEDIPQLLWVCSRHAKKCRRLQAGPLISRWKWVIPKRCFQCGAWIPQEHRPILTPRSVPCMYERLHEYICVYVCLNAYANRYIGVHQHLCALTSVMGIFGYLYVFLRVNV